MKIFLAVLSYFGIGILISFIYWILCEYYNKHNSPLLFELIYTDKDKNCISDDKTNRETMVFFIMLLWPIAVTIFIVILVGIALLKLFEIICDAFEYITQKIIK
ncbi:hypothetical protein [uncultured Methanobrevibacter sp.]|uniref:hypothetical protein n=1 Tax=uncultured Methanobrevibacter sp. TaxID=253161 RepID=UPI0025FCB8E3|nr:hypothetical protein [uncultured Methanobrevibacter sp.]